MFRDRGTCVPSSRRATPSQPDHGLNLEEMTMGTDSQTRDATGQKPSQPGRTDDHRTHAGGHSQEGQKQQQGQPDTKRPGQQGQQPDDSPSPEQPHDSPPGTITDRTITE